MHVKLCLFQLARLSRDDMNAVNNVRHMGGSDGKKTSGVFSLKFDAQKVKLNLFKRWLLFIMFFLYVFFYEISGVFTVS